MAICKRLAGAAALAAAVAAGPTPSHAQTTWIVRNSLVSNVTGTAKIPDKNLRNPWGIAYFPGGPFWVSDNSSGLSTLYDGLGDVEGLVVTITPPAGQTLGNPTGIVWNPVVGNGEFMFSESGTTVPALFIFDGEEGTISAWAPIPGQPTPHATTIVVDNSAGGKGAVYKGLALGTNAKGNFIFAANFRAATVEAYDTTFKLTALTGAFVDKRMPKGFAPFGIQNIDGELYVTFAKQNPLKHDPARGIGLGYVDVFSTDGILLRRFASQGPLNAPWAVIRAPQSFGAWAGQILVGNFGDGWINAFPANGGTSTGPLTDKSSAPLQINGLWDIVSGTGMDASPDTLYFSAGPGNETNGVFGSLTAMTAAPTTTGPNWP